MWIRQNIRKPGEGRLGEQEAVLKAVRAKEGPTDSLSGNSSGRGVGCSLPAQQHGGQLTLDYDGSSRATSTPAAPCRPSPSRSRGAVRPRPPSLPPPRRSRAGSGCQSSRCGGAGWPPIRRRVWPSSTFPSPVRPARCAVCRVRWSIGTVSPRLGRCSSPRRLPPYGEGPGPRVREGRCAGPFRADGGLWPSRSRGPRVSRPCACSRRLIFLPDRSLLGQTGFPARGWPKRAVGRGRSEAESVKAGARAARPDRIPLASVCGMARSSGVLRWFDATCA